MTTAWQSPLGYCALAVVMTAATGLEAQSKADLDAVHRVLDQYAQTEDAGDMVAQAKLMTADRVWIGPEAGRRTDQAMNMKMQQAAFDVAKKETPGVQWFTEARDRLIKFQANGAVAVASFYWYRTPVLPAGAAREIKEALGNVRPLAITHVLVKEGGDWKIAHTHVAFLNSAPARP